MGYLFLEWVGALATSKGGKWGLCLLSRGVTQLVLWNSVLRMGWSRKRLSLKDQNAERLCRPGKNSGVRTKRSWELIVRIKEKVRSRHCLQVCLKACGWIRMPWQEIETSITLTPEEPHILESYFVSHFYLLQFLLEFKPVARPLYVCPHSEVNTSGR